MVWAWIVCRFKWGGGLREKVQVVFLIPQCTPSSIKIITFRLPETTTTRSAKREGKQIGDIKLDVGRMSANKNGAKKPFVTNASDNHTIRPMYLEYTFPMYTLPA